MSPSNAKIRAVDERIRQVVREKTPAQLEREAEEKAADDIITALLRQAREDAQR